MPVVALFVGPQHCSQMSLVVDEHPIRALGPCCPYPAFGIAVRTRRPRRRFHYLYAFVSEDGIEGGGELGVPVADEEPERGEPVGEVCRARTRTMSLSWYFLSSLGRSPVLVDQAVDDLTARDPAGHVDRLAGFMSWRSLFERLVRTVFVVIIGPRDPAPEPAGQAQSRHFEAVQARIRPDVTSPPRPGPNSRANMEPTWGQTGHIKKYLE